MIFSCNTSFKFLQPQHTIFLTQITIPQLKFPKPQTLHLSPSLIYINSQCHCQNTIPTYLSNHYSSITTTSQNNIYIVSQISLYENSRVWKAPDSLFCIKIPFKDNIYIYRGWEGIFIKSLTNVTLNVIARLSVITCRPLAILCDFPTFLPRCHESLLHPLL